MTNDLAFCLYGQFTWPPCPEGAHVKDEPPEEGCVLIRFVRGANDSFRAWLGWVPRMELPSTVEELRKPLETDDNASRLGSSACTYLKRNQTGGLWLDGRYREIVLRFAGAHIIDVYDLGKEGLSPRLRWPLAASFRQRNRDNVSGLSVGFDYVGRTGFFLDLALPTPVPQIVDSLGAPSRENNSAFKNRFNDPVFAFRSVFRVSGDDNEYSKADHAAQIWIGGRRSTPTRAFLSSPDKRLGRFGFAPFRSGAFAGLERRDGDRTRDPSNWWPYSPQYPMIANLKRLGLSMNPEGEVPKEYFDFLTGDWGNDRATVERVSLDLRVSGDSGDAADDPKTTVNYRYTQVVEDDYSSDPKPGTDIVDDDGKILLRMDREAGGWLELDSDEMTIWYQMTWDFPKKNPNENFEKNPDRNPDDKEAVWRYAIEVDVQARIFWNQKIRGDVGKERVHPRRGLRRLRAGTLDDAFRSCTTGRISLERLESENPRSSLPQFEAAVGDGLVVRFQLTPDLAKARLHPNFGLLGFDIVDASESGLRYYLSTPEEKDPLLEPNSRPAITIPVNANFPALDKDMLDEESFRLLELSHDSPADAWTPNGGFASFKIKDSESAVTGELRDFQARLGSLRFVRPAEFPRILDAGDASDDSRLRTYRFKPSPIRFRGVEPMEDAIGVRLNLRLAINAVAPIAPDTPRGDRRERSSPLLIDLGGGGAAQGTFILKIEESMGTGRDWHLIANLSETAIDGGAADRSYVLVSREPFSLIKFSRTPLERVSDLGSSLVATYDSDRRTWLFRKTGANYRYSLPAQVIGDGTDKPRRHEIHDFVDEPGLFRPYPDDNPIGTYLVDFRLPPSAELWIKPSDLPRDFVRPEWATYDIFRQRNDFGLGASLSGFRGEFLYGLSVGIETAREIGPSSNARVAEIEAITGRFIERFFTSRPYEPLERRWIALMAALRRRPERLELWVQDPRNPRPFQPARFASGVSFALRETALHRPAILSPGESESAPPSAIPSQPVRLRDDGPRYHEGGLPGGALWPLESRAFFEALLRDPVSSGGTIEDVALSPTGGDADQTALFLGGNVKIISETRAGLVQRQRVEIAGRIGALWHRAKHVVVYERTVNASAQFAPEERAETRTRRPVLRKVSEFVELMEPTRRYPDTGNASPRSVGFLDSVRFNSKIIAVDSAWGQDVRARKSVDGNDKKLVGWQIPLWNRQSARLRPQVYPQPDVSFVTVAEGTGERPLIAQECLDPENLYFFAEATRDPDTDAWPLRPGIDFADMISPDSLLDALNQNAGGFEGAARKPNTSRILPGYRRFTWRLVQSGERSLLNAERGDKPVFASLESVTFMRGVEHRFDQDTEKLAGLLMGMTGSLSGARFQLNYWGPDGSGGPDISERDDSRRMGSLLAEVRTALSEADAISEEKGELRREALERARWVFSSLTSSLGGGSVDKFEEKLTKVFHADSSIFKATNEARRGFEGLSKNGYSKLEGFLDSGADGCRRIADDIVAGVRQKARLVAEEARAALVRVDAMIAAGKWPETDTKSNFVDEVADQVLVSIDEILDQPRADVGALQSGLEAARAAGRDLEADIQEAISRGIQRVNAASAAFDRSKPWSETRLNEFSDKIQIEFEGVLGDVESAIGEARQRLATEISHSGQKLASIAGAMMSRVVSVRTAGLRALSTGKLHVTQTVGDVLGTLDRFHDDESSTGVYFRLRDQLDKIRSRGNPQYSELARALQQTLDGARNETVRTRATLAKAIHRADGALATLTNVVDGTSRDARIAISQINTVVDGALSLVDRLPDSGYEAIKQQLGVISEFAKGLSIQLESFVDLVSDGLGEIRDIADRAVENAEVRAREAADEAGKITSDVFALLEDGIELFSSEVNGLMDVLRTGSDGAIPALIRERAVKPAIDALLWELSDDDFADLQNRRAKIMQTLTGLAASIEKSVGKLPAFSKDVRDALESACGALTGGLDLSQIRQHFERRIDAIIEDYKVRLRTAFKDQFPQLVELFKQNDIKKILAQAKLLESELRRAFSVVGMSVENARVFGDRLLDRATRIGDGGLTAAPNNILRLYSAATSAPEIGQLRANVDRIRATFRSAEDIIRSTKANALFAQLGDALKSMGLELPFDRIGAEFEIDDKLLENLDISNVFKNFGGLKLDSLFEGVKLPDGLSNYVKVSHDFDPKQGRAWVQVDVTLPMPGRKKLFQLGPFGACFRDALLKGFVRLDADKDEERVRETGEAQIATAIELEVSGQQIVTLESAVIRYTQESGLDFEFDPRNIKLNQVFQFIQDTLGSLFPGEFGGLTIVKDRGIPVGVEHVFSMPPTSLNFGTSGVSNIAIANRFRLMAYPDFVLTDRFNLSRVEQPFIFSIFIIGGTGYVQCDTEYRPFDKALSVAVEAAAGGSAALAFAIGPIAGGVSITLSVALSYHKSIGQPGGGLSVSLVLTLGGNVSLWGMVHVFLVLVLRLSYRSNGQIDASGDLQVEVRVCKWLKLRFRTTVTYQLRGGQSRTQRTTSTSVEPGPDLERIKRRAERLRRVRS